MSINFLARSLPAVRLSRWVPLLALAIAFEVAPLAAEAQKPGKIPRVGVIVPVEPESPTEPNVAAFRQGLRSLGYVEGQNIIVEYRYAHGRAERFTEQAAELVRLQVDAMVVGSWQPTLAAKKATQTIPIVGVAMGSNPVALGIVDSFARPGGNVTGSSWTTGWEFAGKYVELLKETVPRTLRVAYLRDPQATVTAPVNQTSLGAARTAAQSVGLTFQAIETRDFHELDNILAKISKQRGSALIVESSLFFMDHANDITKVATKHGLPSIYGIRVFMDAGGLMMYGPSLAELWRRAAFYVDRILKGAKPGDLPVEQPTKFELVINAKTAKALGLTIPQSLLLRADQIIE
jgi:putative tryptophan/tyrosine transport system substrate-binding protein